MFDRPSPSAGEVRALAHQLLSWADHLSARLAATQELSEEDKHDLIVTVAEAMRTTARERSRLFPGVPLGNANWDVLLDLFIRELNGHRTSLEQLTDSDGPAQASVPTAIETLARAGLVDRAPARPGVAASWLTLTPRGKQGMFELMQKIGDLASLQPNAEPATHDA